ncbi:HAD hydrolase family protein [Salinimicrobium sp. CDJ15-91]|uniref:HAD hydrolase family protein n=1 Tax=Salinimicrobium oceani TaxID=2722702 RepID=A0ABX1CZL5_9FLAO|nr:HAD hydrolase family protein [Salinimicrobium oceani]
MVSDIDGVWTDGSFYYSAEGDVMRRFTTKDSYGVSLARLAGIPLMILSSEENEMVRKRLNKLGVEHVSLGVRNKLEAIRSMCKEWKISLSEVVFLGDDMNDFHLLGKVGLFACPADAYPRIKENAGLVLEKKGGEGAFREFVEKLLDQENKLQETYEKYVRECLEKQE